MKLIDRLVQQIQAKKSPVVVGLDPVVSRIPAVYFQNRAGRSETAAIADAIVACNRDVIDAVSDIAPAVKPQMAFFEMYGAAGVEAFERTVALARDKGLFVINDAKRNDIGSTALAYARGHLGMVPSIDGGWIPGSGSDFLTVSPYLGPESLMPFIDVCMEHDKGVFILVKTSNPGNGLVQDAVTPGGKTVAEGVAGFVNGRAAAYRGECGLSPIGAVVGATYPEDAEKLRALMPHSLFLVPGYGAQGGTAGDVAPNFNPDGLGALVSASRGILYGYEEEFHRDRITREQYKENVRRNAEAMRRDIHGMIKKRCPDMRY